jgi:hypothetical protein
MSSLKQGTESVLNRNGYIIVRLDCNVNTTAMNTQYKDGCLLDCSAV